MGRRRCRQALRSRRHARHPRQAVEGALQDIGGAVLVDDAARRLRLASAAISSRSTAAVDSARPRARSAHPSAAAEGGRRRGRLRRAPSLPSMLTGRASTKPTALRSAASASSRPASAQRSAHDRLDAGCEPAGRIAGRDPDRLGPEVKPDQRAAGSSSQWTSTSGRTGAGMPEA